MKKIFCVIAAVGLGVLLASAGCSSMGENTKRGAVGGALLGSIAGGVIGHQSGNGVAGAAIGAGVGALGGGLIGNSIDNKQEVKVSGEKLGISDVIALSKGGMSDDALIAKIQASGSVFNMSVEEIEVLRKEGVSAKVINAMMGKK
jgi:uncharacterized membrane protein